MAASMGCWGSSCPALLADLTGVDGADPALVALQQGPQPAGTLLELMTMAPSFFNPAVTSTADSRVSSTTTT